jgi:hypothetical protein
MSKRKSKQTPRPLLGDAEHVARYCHHQRVLRDQETGEVISILDAFKLRASINEKELSVEHFEKLGAGFNARIKNAAAIFRSKIIHDPVTPDSMISVLNVGSIIEIGKATGKELRVRDKSRPDRPAYAHVIGLPPDNSDSNLLASLSDEGIKSCHLIENIDKLP